MKKIEAIIRRSKLGELKSALSQLGVQGITVLDAGGFGQQRGHPFTTEAEDEVLLVPKYKIEIFTTDAMVQPVLENIAAICSTGHPGDGKIFVSPVEDALRIRTGQKGEEAL